MTTICVGISHKQAPIAVRERLAVPKEQLPDRLQELRQLPGIREVLLVSTCNRLEIFAATSSPQSAEDILRALGPDPLDHQPLLDTRGTTPREEHLGHATARERAHELVATQRSRHASL